MMLATYQVVCVLRYLETLPQGIDIIDAAFTSSVPTASWMMTRSRLRHQMTDLLALSAQQRRQLADAVAHDVEFHASGEVASFSFQFWALDDSVRDVAHPFLVEFYAILMAGFPEAFAIPQLSGAQLEADLRTANTTQVCPACLDALPAPVKGRTQVDRDHFFPKRFYPMLAVHPHNLVLVCMNCNSRNKLDRDPLLPEAGGADLSDATAASIRVLPGRIASVATPYGDGLHGALHVEFDGIDVKIAGKTGSEPWGDRFAGFDSMFNITDRWRQQVEYVDDDLIGRCTIGQSSITLDETKARLVEVCREMEPRVFTYPICFLRMKRAEWILANRLGAFTAECGTRLRERGLSTGAADR